MSIPQQMNFLQSTLKDSSDPANLARCLGAHATVLQRGELLAFCMAMIMELTAREAVKNLNL